MDSEKKPAEAACESFTKDFGGELQPAWGSYRRFRILTEIEADIDAARLIIKKSKPDSTEQQIAQAWLAALEREWSTVLNYS